MAITIIVTEKEREILDSFVIEFEFLFKDKLGELLADTDRGIELDAPELEKIFITALENAIKERKKKTF